MEGGINIFVLISFPLTEDTPTPGGRKPLHFVNDESLKNGDVANSFYYTSWNHAGTHVDAPGHMIPNGKSITDLDINYFIFDRPYIKDIPKADAKLITIEDLMASEREMAECDILLIRTGFTKYRLADPVRYRDRNPGLSLDAARYLASNRFPKLRAVGIDSISFASSAYMEEGIESHKVLFRKEGPKAVLLIEDLNLSLDLGLLKTIKRVYVVPFLVVGLDSSPCTVLAEGD
ncbi:MAG: cyclase family protein [Firmicutes bacterium]|nr:cyclase family protein [Bacillota bacterium]